MAFMRAEPRTNGPSAIGIILPVHFGPPTPVRPVRQVNYRKSDGRFDVTNVRFRRLAPIGPYSPELALRMGLAGRTALDCHVATDGSLENCVIIGELTTHPVFGQSALRMALQGWMTAMSSPQSVKTPLDGIWRVEVNYRRRTMADTQ